MRDFLYIFSFIILFIVGVSVIRVMYNVEPLTFMSFLELISTIDLDFSGVILSISLVRLSITNLSNLVVTDISTFMTWLGALGDTIYSFMILPFGIIADLIEFLRSVISTFVILVGFNPFVKG